MNYNAIDELHEILQRYQLSFTEKAYGDENDDHDLLMNVFSLSPDIKRENRQYWGRELGMCWQLLIVEIFRQTRDDFQPALRFGNDEPCDLVAGNLAIDTKYRIGSGDSGTLKKFKSYGPLLRANGYEPTLLILRTDNLPAAIKACEKGTWNVLIGDDALSFVNQLTKFDIRQFLIEQANNYPVLRD